MRKSARYAKIITRSGDDSCYVVTYPGLLCGGCNGDDEQRVFAESVVIVDETIALYRADGKPLPPPTNALALAIAY